MHVDPKEHPPVMYIRKADAFQKLFHFKELKLSLGLPIPWPRYLPFVDSAS
jgi:hypothetical protein